MSFGFGGEFEMTEITLKLTFEELKQIDKYIEYHDYDCDKPLLEKIKNAYPKPETLLDVIRNLGYSYDCCYEIVDAVEEFEKSKEPEKWDVVRESKKWCEENPEKSVEDYLTPQKPLCAQGARGLVGPGPGPKGVIVGYEPTPQTPEQIEKSLRKAFVKVQQTEEWKETQRKIDSNYDDKNFKNSLDLIKEWGEKNKPPTLYEILMDWWINHLDMMEQSDERIIDGLVDRIDKKFIPPSSDRNGYEWEKCLKIMRDKLR